MKVFKKIYTIFAASACAFLLLNGCSAITNGLSSAEAADFSVSGEISCSGASPRAAISALKDDITWKISAKKSDGSESVEPVTAKNMTFTLNLPSAGKWKIFASGFSGETQILSGEKEVTVDVKGLTGINIAVAVSLDFSKLADFDAVTGNVELPVTDKTGKIAKVSGNLTYVLYDVEPVEEDSGEEVSEEYYEKLEELMKPKSFSANFANGAATIKLSDLVPGIYDAKIQFLDSAGNALYSCMEQFTVYSGFTTDTWYGTAPYLSDGKFELTSALLGTFASYIVPSTKMVLYNFSEILENESWNEEYKYYFADSLAGINLNNADFSSGLAYATVNAFTFDKNGAFYYLAVEESDIILKSDRSNFTASDTGRAPGSEHFIAIDRETDKLWLFAGSGESGLYCFYDISDITQLPAYANESYISSNYFYYGDGEGENYTPKIMTAGDGLVYFAKLNSSTNLSKIYLTSSDVTSDVVTNGSNIELHCRNTMKLDISNLGLSAFATITDMIYQNGCVYILLRDVRTPSYNSSTISEEYPLCSRGAVIKYDTVSKETKTIGWTSNALDSSGKYLYGYSTDGSPLYKNGQILKVSSSDLENFNLSFPNIYSPANSNEGFYGPVKFIAIKPKKLVIADDGLAFYTDENDAYKYKNANRVVTVDLDTFTLICNDTGVQFEREYSDYLAGSGFSKSGNTFGYITTEDMSTGYQNDVNFVIPCGD